MTIGIMKAHNSNQAEHRLGVRYGRDGVTELHLTDEFDFVAYYLTQKFIG
jgi:hypothetical protein